jgi:hypothetical protein
MAFAAPVILWGADAPSDVLREAALAAQPAAIEAQPCGHSRSRLLSLLERRLQEGVA